MAYTEMIGSKSGGGCAVEVIKDYNGTLQSGSSSYNQLYKELNVTREQIVNKYSAIGVTAYKGSVGSWTPFNSMIIPTAIVGVYNQLPINKYDAQTTTDQRLLIQLALYTDGRNPLLQILDYSKTLNTARLVLWGILK